MVKSVRALATAAFAAALLAVAGAHAAPLQGQIGFGGAFTPTGGTGLGDATGLEIIDSVVLQDSQEGDFVGIPDGETVIWSPLTFDPPDLPVTPLWFIEPTPGVVFEFDLLTVEVLVQNESFLALGGTGTLMATGFDPTAGTWSFNSEGGLAGVFTFSSNTVTPMPAPATLLLVGLGLVALGRVRRRR